MVWSVSVWNVSRGWAWLSDNQRAFKFKAVSDKGRCDSLNENIGRGWALTICNEIKPCPQKTKVQQLLPETGCGM